MFAKISNFADFKKKIDQGDQSVESLRLLNEIIAEFDRLLDDEQYQSIEKIKTMGAAYLCVVGLIPEYEIEDVGFYQSNSILNPLKSHNRSGLT